MANTTQGIGLNTYDLSIDNTAEFISGMSANMEKIDREVTDKVKVNNTPSTVNFIAENGVISKLSNGITEIPLKGEKGDTGAKGDAGTASTAIDDSVTNFEQTWTSGNISLHLKSINDEIKTLNKKTIFPRAKTTPTLLKNKKTFKGFITGDSIMAGTGATTYNESFAWQLTLNLYNFNKVGLTNDFVLTTTAVGGTTIQNVIPSIAYSNNVDGITNKTKIHTDYPYWLIGTGRNDTTATSLEDYEYYLRLIAKQANFLGIDLVFISAPPKINRNTEEILDTNDITVTEKYILFRDVIEKVAKEEAVSFIDLYTEIVVRKYKEDSILKYYKDDIHLSDLGQKLLADMVLSCLSTPSSETFSISQFEDKELKLIPQVYLTPKVLSNATIESISPSATRFAHTGIRDGIKIADGGYVIFEIPQIKNSRLLITTMSKASTGQYSVQVPNGMWLDSSTSINVSVPNPFNLVYDVTKEWVKKDQIYSSVKVSASGGDVYLTGITIISPYLLSYHSDVCGEKVGNWTMQYYDASNKCIMSNTINDTLKIKWFGENISFQLFKGSTYGQCEIITDGISEIVDLYNTSATSIIKSIDKENGYHETVIKVIEKNASASDNKVGIKYLKNYARRNNINSILSIVGENISVYLNTGKFNYIKGDNIVITDNILTSNTYQTIETIII